MVKFREHVISYGDTMQSIAQSTLGNMSLWTEIVTFNNLRYPYIVDTVEEKLKNPEHLKTIGDTILVRITADEQSQLISSLKRMNEFSQEEIYALALGKDLNIFPQSSSSITPGIDSEILELKGNARGQIATVRGVENLKQALFIRIATPLGSYIGHPNFGSKIHNFIGKLNTKENISLLNIEVERAVRTDGRVTDVDLVNYIVKGNMYAAHLKIRTITLDEAFDFIISTRNSGTIMLENDLVNISDLRM